MRIYLPIVTSNPYKWSNGCILTALSKLSFNLSRHISVCFFIKGKNSAILEGWKTRLQIFLQCFQLSTSRRMKIKEKLVMTFANFNFRKLFRQVYHPPLLVDAKASPNSGFAKSYVLVLHRWSFDNNILVRTSTSSVITIGLNGFIHNFKTAPYLLVRFVKYWYLS